MSIKSQFPLDGAIVADCAIALNEASAINKKRISFFKVKIFDVKNYKTNYKNNFRTFKYKYTKIGENLSLLLLSSVI